MAIALDSATEQRLQQELANGPFREPSDLIAHALDLIAAEREDFVTRRARLLTRLEESSAQATRGEGYTEEELRARMAERRSNSKLTLSA